MRIVPNHATVASQSSGRLRIRLDPTKNRPSTLSRVEAQIAEHPGVTRVEAHPWSGSLVIHYQPSDVDFETLLTALRSTGLVVEVPSSPERAHPPGAPSSAAVSV